MVRLPPLKFAASVAWEAWNVKTRLRRALHLFESRSLVLNFLGENLTSKQQAALPKYLAPHQPSPGRHLRSGFDLRQRLQGALMHFPLPIGVSEINIVTPSVCA